MPRSESAHEWMDDMIRAHTDDNDMTTGKDDTDACPECKHIIHHKMSCSHNHATKWRSITEVELLGDGQ